jgi:hypothetical protein
MVDEEISKKTTGNSFQNINTPGSGGGESAGLSNKNFSKFFAS